MATYKVPQDVEAEDKLIGPFGFRQFIYLAIAAGSGFMVYVFWQIFPLLAIIPLPVCALFIIIALPLRKEQPMETYLIAVLRFFLKPRNRMWNPDGTISYVEIIAPKAVTQSLAKGFGAETATEKIDYLARVMDSRGWAMKGVPLGGTNVSTEVMAEAEHAVDVFDTSAQVSQSFATMIAKQDEDRHQAAVAILQQTAPTQTTIAAPHYDPYPSSMHQRVVQPNDTHHRTTSGAPKHHKEPAKPPVPPPVSPDIIRLANNDDLSISAIAHEAHRLTNGQDEVVINLH